MLQRFKQLTNINKVLLILVVLVSAPFLAIPVLAIIVMGGSAFVSDVSCMNHTSKPNTVLEAQATELQSIKVVAGNDGSWKQEYTGRDCGNSAQRFYAERTIDLSGKAGDTLQEARSQLAQQGYYLTDEEYVGLRKDTCEGRYRGVMQLKDGGKAVLELHGTLTTTACNSRDLLTESDFSDTSTETLQLHLYSSLADS